MEVRTNFPGVYDNKPTPNGGTQGTTPKENFAEITRMLNFANSRFPCHEMRIRAAMVLIEQAKRHILEADKLVDGPEQGSAAESSNNEQNQWKSAMKKASRRLEDRIRLIEAYQAALLLEISREAKIAQSQLQIVSQASGIPMSCTPTRRTSLMIDLPP